jgi:dihydrofolate reductase
MFNRVSADGYFSGADGNLDWAVPDEELEGSAAGQLSGTGTILFGRRTYDMFERFWPNALTDTATAPDPHAPGRQTQALRAMAVWINEATKVVVSRTRKEVTWKNSRLLPEFDPREIEALKSQAGSDIMIFGSGSIVSQLTQHRLIDEYQFVVSPILLGCGRSLLSDVSKSLRVNLLEAKPYPSGNVMLRYAPSK